MTEGIVPLLQRIKSEKEVHRDWLVKWKAKGGTLENYPEHETIDDFIKREEDAIKNLEAAIARAEA